MKNKTRILFHLIENRTKDFSILGISKTLKINYRIAFEEIKRLEKQKLVAIKKAGSSNMCTFSNRFNHEVLEVEEERREAVLKNLDLRIVYNDLAEIKTPFFIMLLFGSYAKGTQHKHSDIDLCIISDDEKAISNAESVIRRFPYDIHLLDFTYAQFMQMLDTQQDNVGKEMLKHNIIWYGIEDFYRLINKI